jgi:hypothetical protein
LPCEHFIGLDLGRSRDYTAIAVVTPDEAYLEARRSLEELLDSLEATSVHPHADDVDLRHLEREIEARLYYNPMPEPSYHVRHLERMPLGTSYVSVAHHVLAILDQLPGAELAVDATGVGAAVVDLLSSEGLRFRAVTITGAGEEKREGMSYWVSKRDLVARAQVLLQQRRLKIAATLPEASTLVDELRGFRLKLSPRGHEYYKPLREGDHDDLLAALLLALWAAGQETLPVDPTLVGTSEPFPGAPDADLYHLDDPYKGRF